jgi:hypothetical protein
MLTLTDCIELSGLCESEIAAIAAHEHVPEIVACEIAYYLTQCPEGARCIETMITNDIYEAEVRGQIKRAHHLKAVLEHFRQTHAEAALH